MLRYCKTSGRWFEPSRGSQKKKERKRVPFFFCFFSFVSEPPMSTITGSRRRRHDTTFAAFYQNRWRLAIEANSYGSLRETLLIHDVAGSSPAGGAKEIAFAVSFFVVYNACGGVV